MMYNFSYTNANVNQHSSYKSNEARHKIKIKMNGLVKVNKQAVLIIK